MTDHPVADVLADDLLATTAAIAEWLGVNEDRARRLCRNRAIPAFRIGAKIYAMRKSTFLTWMADRESETLSEVGLRAVIRENGELNLALERHGVEVPFEVPA